MDAYNFTDDVDALPLHDEAPHREAGVPFIDHSEPGPYTEIGRAYRMAAVERNIPRVQMMFAGMAGVAALGVAVGAFFLLRPRKDLEKLEP